MGETVRNDEGKMDFQEKVKEIAGALFESGWVEGIVEESLKKAIIRAVDDQFSYSGEAYKKIKEIVSDSMTKSIGNFNPGYIPRLETVMQGIIDQTVIGDQKRLLNNFMTFIDKSKIPEPEEGKWYSVITLEDIFKEYCKYVSKKIETFGREIYYDDEPSYALVECSAEIVPEDDRYSYGFTNNKHGFLCLSIGEDETHDNKLICNFKVPIVMWDSNKKKGWSFYGEPGEISYGNLAIMNEMLCYLTMLKCNAVYISDSAKRLDEEVEPEQKPECNWS